MKSIRKVMLASVLSLSALSAVTFTSCKKDDSGCPVGYEGKDCKTESRVKFIKVWNASDQINGSQIIYTTNITAGVNINAVLIAPSFSKDFFDNPINATVSEDRITIPNQKPDGNGDYSVDGVGIYNNGKITWNYNITEVSTSTTQTYTGVWQ